MKKIWTSYPIPFMVPLKNALIVQIQNNSLAQMLIRHRQESFITTKHLAKQKHFPCTKEKDVHHRAQKQNRMKKYRYIIK